MKKRTELRKAVALVEGEVGELLKECDLPDQHPIDGLLEVVRHTGAMMRLLGQLCSELGLRPGDVKVRINVKTGEGIKYTKEDSALHGYNHVGDGAQHILVLMYGQWADRYARACKLALDANIDERLVRNAEQTSTVMFEAISEAIKEVEMTPVMAQQLSLALAKQLRKHIAPLESNIIEGQVS